MDVGSLVVKLEGNTTGLQTALSKSTQVMDQLRAKSDQVQRQVSTHFTSMSAAGKSMAASLGISLGVAGLINYAKNIIEVNDRLSDLADQTGFAAGTLSGLRTTVENAGVSIDTFATSIRFAQRNLGNANEESDKAAVAFKALGLSFEEMKNVSPEELFKKVVKGVSEFSRESDRAALLGMTLGRQFSQLSGVVGTLANNFETLSKSGLSDETVNRLGAIGDGFHTISNRIQDLAAGPLLQMAEAIKQVFGLFNPKEELLDRLTKLKFKLRDINTELNATKDGSFLSKLFNVDVSVFKAANGEVILKMSKDANADLKEVVRQRALTMQEMLDVMTKIEDANKPAATGTKKLALPDTKAAEALKSVIEGLKKEIISVQAEKIALTEGSLAAEIWTKTHDAMVQLGLTKLPAAVQRLIDQYKQEKAALDAINEAARTTEEINKQLLEQDEKRFQAGQNLIAQQRILKDAGMSDVERQLKAVNDQYQAIIQSIKEMQLANPNSGDFSGDLAQAASNYKNAMAAIKGPKPLLDIGLDDLARDMDKAAQQAKIFGTEFNQAGAEVDAMRRFLGNLEPGIDLANSKIQEQIDKLKDLEQSIKTVNAVQDVIANFGQAFGNALQDFSSGSVTAAQAVRNMANSVMRSIADMVWKLGVVEPMLKAFRDAVAGGTGGVGGINLDILWKGMTGQKIEPPAMPKPQPLPVQPVIPAEPVIAATGAADSAAAATAIQAQSATATAAIEAAGATATVAIESTGSVATAGIQSAVVVGETAIGNVAAVAQSGIDAVRAVAIATIQESAAAGGASSGEGDARTSGEVGWIGSLFKFGGGQDFRGTNTPNGLGGDSGSGWGDGAYDGGGDLGGGGFGGEFARGGRVPGSGPKRIVAHGGEEILTPEQQRNRRRPMGSNVTVHMNISTPDASSFRESESQTHSRMLAAISRNRNR